MMDEKKQALHDFLKAKARHISVAGFEVSAIICAADEQSAVVMLCESLSVPVLEITDSHPDPLITELTAVLFEDSLTVLHVLASLDKKLVDYIRGLTAGMMQASVVDGAISQPVPKQGALVLLLDESAWGDLPCQDIVTGVFRV